MFILEKGIKKILYVILKSLRILCLEFLIWIKVIKIEDIWIRKEVLRKEIF